MSELYAPGGDFDTAPVLGVNTPSDQNPDQDYMEGPQLQSPKDSARMEVTTTDASHDVCMNLGHTGRKQVGQTMILPVYPTRHNPTTKPNPINLNDYPSTASFDIPSNNELLYDLLPNSTRRHSSHQTKHTGLLHPGTSPDILRCINDRSDLLENILDSSKHMSEEIDAQDRAINLRSPCQSTNTTAYQHHRVSAREDQLKKVDLALTTNPCPWPGCSVKDRSRQRLKYVYSPYTRRKYY